MEFSLPLSTDDCKFLADGRQIVKGILADEKISGVSAGVNLSVATCEFPVRVVGVRRYDNFRQLVLNEGLRNSVPAAATVADGVKSLQGASPDAEVEGKGVIALV